jgi:ketosteroid isomerase-like protein
MTPNKTTVARYIDGFNALDHALILSCLTDDVEWIMHGAFHHVGKEAFDKEIENDAFEGKPVVALTRMTEENDVVIAEGTVLATKKGGEKLPLVFCDVFEMRAGKIAKLTGFIAPAGGN